MRGVIFYAVTSVFTPECFVSLCSFWSCQFDVCWEKSSQKRCVQSVLSHTHVVPEVNSKVQCHKTAVWTCGAFTVFVLVWDTAVSVSVSDVMMCYFLCLQCAWCMYSDCVYVELRETQAETLVSGVEMEGKKKESCSRLCVTASVWGQFRSQLSRSLSSSAQFSSFSPSWFKKTRAGIYSALREFRVSAQHVSRRMKVNLGLIVK